MKIKKRLIISFCIVMFMPMLLFIGGMAFLKIMINKDVLPPPLMGENIIHLKELMHNNYQFQSMFLDFCASELVITILITLVVFLWIYKGIIPQIKLLTEAAKRIQEGDLDFSVRCKGKDELSELCNAFEDMRLRLENSTKEKLEDEAEQKALISNIAHDLKTPITAIKGYAEGILDGVAETPEKKEKYIRTIFNKANDMNNLINELTLYSKIDTNRIPYNFQRLNLQKYFKDCVDEMGMDLDNQHIELNYMNYVMDDVEIIADPEQLARIINNIVSNSVKYMKANVKSRINITIKDVGDFVQVDIEDNGKGISTADLPYVFDRFFRADASRNSAAGGSGIGLSIVKKIVEDHGGKIWVTSKEDQGTTMSFVIRKYQEVIYE